MDAGDATLSAEPCADAPQATRNMDSIRYANRTSTHVSNTIPIPPWSTFESESDSEDEGEENHSSGVCICADCLGNLLATRNLTGDLGDHMFGHLVSTDLARDILSSFIADGFVQVFEVCGEPASQTLVGPHSDDAQDAVRQAFEAAVTSGCIRPSTGTSSFEERLQPASQKEAKKEKTYLFKWRSFPQEPFNRDGLVSFLNEVTDRAFAIMQSQFPTTKMELRHRFATSEHALFLAYGLDPQDIQPNFFLLPIEAFVDEGLKIVDEKYLSFSAFRLVGGSHTFPIAGLKEMKNYAECLKYAQPWAWYVLGMTFSQNLVVLSRGDGSDWEHLPLVPCDGRGSIELIRILLGLVLADAVDLGQNPYIELVSEIFACHFNTLAPSNAVSSAAGSHFDADGFDDIASPSRYNTPSTIPHERQPAKRHHSEVEKEDEDERPLGKKTRKANYVAANPTTFSPTDFGD